MALAATACETGAYEKAAKVCAVWECNASDDNVMETICRMGLGRAAKMYVIMDGSVCLRGVYRDHFQPISKGQLDYYYASQRLHALAEALFPGEERKAEREAWVSGLLEDLKHQGPWTLLEAVSEHELA